MKRKQLYLIRDEAAEVYLNPMVFNSEGEARRVFSDEVNRASADNALYQHPEHFTLFQLGEYDHETGRMYFDQGSIVDLGFASGALRYVVSGEDVMVRESPPG